MFGPVDGGAPDLAGKGVVDPVGMILSAAMMVRHLGMGAKAQATEEAVAKAVRAQERTRDVGGTLSAAEAGDAIARRL